MINYNFDKKDQILYINYSEEIIFEDYKKLIDDFEIILLKDGFPKNLRTLSDYTQATINMDYTMIPVLFTQMQQFFDKFESIVEAFIHVNPFETALSVIAKEEAASQSVYRSEVFTTREFALAWLNKHF